MKSKTRRTMAVAGLLISFVVARSTYAEKTTDVSDQLTIVPASPIEFVPIPPGTGFRRVVVMGEGADATAGANEQLIYSNTLGTFGAALGAGKLVADDITTTVPGGCALVRYEFPVVGKVNPAGIGGAFTVDFAMYRSCPQAVPPQSRPLLIIPGTQGQRTFTDQCQNTTDDDGDNTVNDGCPADGETETGADCSNNVDDDGDTKVNDGCPAVGPAETDVDSVPRIISFIAQPNILLETNMWFGVKFSRNNAGPIIGTPPLTGFSCDQWDFPGFPCDADAGGFPEYPHASFNLEIFTDWACTNSYTGYKNDKPSGSLFNPGANIFLADDIQLSNAGCNMIAYEVAIRGGGFYTFRMTQDSGSGLIAGTERTWSQAINPDVRIVRFTFDPPIPLPRNLWFEAKVNNSTGSVVIAGQQACIGETGDRVYTVVDGTRPEVLPEVLGLGIHGAFSLAITCAGAAPVGACCDMVFTQCVGGTDDGRLCCPANVDLSPFCYSDPARTDTYPPCTPPGTCEVTCREVPQMNCPWPPPVAGYRSPFDVLPAWVEGGTCDSDPFPVACGASACCRPDDVCENLTLNQCNAVPPLEAPRAWQRGVYCGVGNQICPIDACLGGEGDCLVAHEGTGCRDPDCCNDVCSADIYCCTVEWDQICAELADGLCLLSEHEHCFATQPADAALLVTADSVTRFSNTWASQDSTDPRFCCSTNAPDAVGYGTIWFKFVATDTSARISTCGSEPTRDSLINVLAVGDPTTDETACATLSMIACSDDVEGCGEDRHGRICVNDLIPGRPYYVMVGSKTSEDQGLLEIEIRSPCSEEPIWNSVDCNGNGVADGCELGRRVAGDCNGNDRLDECDIADGISIDCDGNLFLDECTAVVDELTPESPRSIYGFGSSADMDDTWLVVGAGLESQFPNESKLLHIFKKTAVGWDLESKFELPVSPSYVATESGWIVASGNRDSLAYLFRFDGQRWISAGTLAGPETEGCDRFGAPVAIRDNTIALGKGFCPSALPQTPELVYIYRYDGETWIEQARISAPWENGRESFGAALAIDGGRLLVGAPAFSIDGPGLVHVYREFGATWEHEIALVPSDGHNGNGFGRAVSLDADAAVVGATFADDLGAVYVFRRWRGSWTQETKLTASPRRADRFGWSVSVVGNLVVTGSRYRESANVFRRVAGQWREETPLVAPDGRTGYFGNTVLVDGTLAVVGAPRHPPEYGNSVGNVYVFQLGPNDCNNNKVADGCDIRDGASRDCLFNDIPDECEVDSGMDCNNNGVPDDCDLRDRVSFDCDRDGVPDECLGLAPFDADADGDKDLFDLGVFFRCYRGAGSPLPDYICAVFDVQHNCVMDLSDFAAFHSVFSGPQAP